MCAIIEESLDVVQGEVLDFLHLYSRNIYHVCHRSLINYCKSKLRCPVDRRSLKA